MSEYYMIIEKQVGFSIDLGFNEAEGWQRQWYYKV